MEIKMNDVFQLLELLGWKIIDESWYDEEGVEGTRLINPDGKEFAIHEWGNDCNFEDLMDELKEYYER